MVKAKSAVTYIFLFVGVFILIMIAISGLAQKGQLTNTNLSDTQDANAAANAQQEAIIQPFMQGLSGLQMVLLILMILGGISIFIFAIVKRKRSRY